MKRPRAFGAWCSSAAAMLELVVFVIEAASDPDSKSLMLFAALTVVLSGFAVDSWKRYFEALIEFKLASSASAGDDAFNRAIDSNV